MENLYIAKSNICLSFNMIWISNSLIAFLAVLALYITNNMKFQITFISLYCAISSYFGEIIIKQIV